MSGVGIGLIAYYLVTRLTPLIIYIFFGKRIAKATGIEQFALLFNSLVCFIPLIGEIYYLAAFFAGIFLFFIILNDIFESEEKVS